MADAKCKACGAPLRFVAMVSGKQNPLEIEPSPEGNVQIQSDGLGRVVSRLELDTLRLSGVPLFLSHFVRCPAAGSFRR